MNNKKITIFDTTLRDGEQSPGASLTATEKLNLAHYLKSLGVDVIEAGFPVISQGDFNAVRQIAEEVQGVTICALARAVDKDIRAAAEALEPARKKRIHTFIATSELHLTYKLKLSQDEVLERAITAVKLAKTFTSDVEFSAEDATRTDRAYLVRVINAVIIAGATTINIPDTVGYSMPDEFGELIAYLKKEVKGIENVALSVHCHNDLGMAVANSLSAIKNGADQVECTVNGIGERAGNCALEELVIALKTRNDLYPVTTNINTQEISKTSKMVEKLTGLAVQANKAIVGRNAFAHEAGIHQHGMISNRKTYEIIRPEDIGLNGTTLIIGKHSGKHALKDWLDRRKIVLTEQEFNDLNDQIKIASDEKKVLDDHDIVRLLEHFKIRTIVI
jgi:2-isopropylmalate synthase